MKSGLFVLSLLSFLGPTPALAGAATSVPKTSGKMLALLMTQINVYDAILDVRVNDLPLVKTQHFEYTKGAGTPYVRIPDLLLRPGKNRLELTLTERNPDKEQHLDLSLVELATLDPQVVKTMLHHITPSLATLKDKPVIVELAFEVTGSPPRWSFVTSPKIAPGAASEAKLKAAAVALARQWAQKAPGSEAAFPEQEQSARRGGAQGDANVVNLRRWIAHKALRCDLRAEQSTMQIFGDGRLARLVWGPLLPWRFVGGAHDAPEGRMGPVDIEMDLWFRLDDKGAFVPVAAWQTGVAPDRL